MQRSQVILVVLVVMAGCGGRSAHLPDGWTAKTDGRTGQDGPVSDGQAPKTCTSLALVGKATLEVADTNKRGPRIAFDGERFAVVWHSQPAPISSLNGALRFALVDSAAKTTTPDGIPLGSDDGMLRPSLLAAAGEYTVLHALATSGLPRVELRRIDAQGKTLWSATVQGHAALADLALHPSGYALLLAGFSGSPQLVSIDKAGKASSPKSIITAQVMADVWLAARPGGFAAALYSTNSNGALHLLDSSFAELGQDMVGHSSIKSPSFAVTGSGFASLYSYPARDIEAEVYDSSGKDLERHTLSGNTPAPTTTGHTALSWTGRQLIAIYPSANPNLYQLRLLDASARPVGAAIPLPGCLATAFTVHSAWGKGRLAVVSVNSASGVLKSAVCVTVMECR